MIIVHLMKPLLYLINLIPKSLISIYSWLHLKMRKRYFYLTSISPNTGMNLLCVPCLTFKHIQQTNLGNSHHLWDWSFIGCGIYWLIESWFQLHFTDIYWAPCGSDTMCDPFRCSLSIPISSSTAYANLPITSHQHLSCHLRTALSLPPATCHTPHILHCNPSCKTLFAPSKVQ